MTQKCVCVGGGSTELLNMSGYVWGGGGGGGRKKAYIQPDFVKGRRQASSSKHPGYELENQSIRLKNPWIRCSFNLLEEGWKNTHWSSGVKKKRRVCSKPAQRHTYRHTFLNSIIDNSFSFIPSGFLLPRLLIKFPSFPLSVKRSHSPFTWI